MASPRWRGVISRLPARSAMVRATLMIRSWLRALSPRLTKYFSSRVSAYGVRGQKAFTSLRPMLALQKRWVPFSRSRWICRAATTRCRITAELSSFFRLFIS